MKITKRRLQKIIKESLLVEEQQKLVTESVSDMRQLEDKVNSAAFGISTTFSELMYKLKDGIPPGDISPTWANEVESAESELEARILGAVHAAIQEIEAKLTNNRYTMSEEKK